MSQHVTLHSKFLSGELVFIERETVSYLAICHRGDRQAPSILFACASNSAVVWSVDSVASVSYDV